MTVLQHCMSAMDRMGRRAGTDSTLHVKAAMAMVLVGEVFHAINEEDFNAWQTDVADCLGARPEV